MVRAHDVLVPPAVEGGRSTLLAAACSYVHLSRQRSPGRPTVVKRPRRPSRTMAFHPLDAPVSAGCIARRIHMPDSPAGAGIPTECRAVGRCRKPMVGLSLL